MKRFIPIITLILLLLAVTPAIAQSTVVRAVLFYSPFCGHCHKVINEHIPMLSQQYNQEVIWTYVAEEPGQETSEIPPLVALEGDVLQIVFINTATPLGNELFGKAIEAYEIPEPAGVPTLIIGDQYMVGSIDIPTQLPGIVAEGLSQSGIDWPDIPGLEESVAQLAPFEDQQGETPEPETAVPDTEEPIQNDPAATDDPIGEEDLPVSGNPGPIQLNPDELSIRERVLLDPLGNTFSIIVLIGMALSVAGIIFRWVSTGIYGKNPELSWHLFVLILVGIGVASYLSFVESTGTEAVCGPVGDCNTVQQSEYALLFGVIPIGTLGLVGYALLMIAWFLSGMKTRSLANLAKIAFFLLALGGTVFSIYLTFLEPFVIGATCMWCLSSAVIMTLLTILSTDPARYTFQKWRT